jgi:hypothetical protein
LRLELRRIDDPTTRATSSPPRSEVVAGADASDAPASAVVFKTWDFRGRRLRDAVAAAPCATSPAASPAGAPIASGGDRVEGSGAALSLPTAVYFWPPAGAARLEIAADGRVAVTASSELPALPGAQDSPPAPSGPVPAWSSLPLGGPVRLLHGLVLPGARAFLPIHPTNRAELARAGAMLRLVLATRLVANPPAPPTAMRPLRPSGRRPALELLVAVPRGQPARAGHGMWKLPVGAEVRFGSRAGVARILYLGSTRSTGAKLSAVLDGRVAYCGGLATARGQLVLPVRAGRHSLRIDAPASVAVFIDRPVQSQAAFRRLFLTAIDARHATRIRVPGGSGGRRVVGLVLYGGGHPASAGAVKLMVDAGHHHARGRLSTGRTVVERTASVEPEPLEEAVLLNTAHAPAWKSQAFFVPLADDLPRGGHILTVEPRRLAGPIYLRIFEHPLEVPAP